MLATIAILAVLEASLSFDNAVVNAKILELMSLAWRKIFLTVGIAVAVVGMRIIFPLAIVGITAKLTPFEAVDLALNHGELYGAKLEAAHPMISAFGGIFLLLLFLDFMLEERSITWLSWLERLLAAFGKKIDRLSILVTVTVIVIIGSITGSLAVMISGSLGLVAYLLVKGAGSYFEKQQNESQQPKDQSQVVLATGKAAFFLFMYLEVLDASFSFDGVIGAFAISNNLFVIAAGLGIGALYIRSLTVYLVKKGSLKEYTYLEHGAFWAIGSLAVCMIVGTAQSVPEVITGLTSGVLIAAAQASSVVRNRRNARRELNTAPKEELSPAPARI